MVVGCDVPVRVMVVWVMVVHAVVMRVVGMPAMDMVVGCDAPVRAMVVHAVVVHVMVVRTVVVHACVCSSCGHDGRV
ncbi:hypothetical protein ID866_13142 [Astraeus odoratus]|nr:hypothetical protein ID866_13142 [Astraeus odoratus]